MRKPTPHPDPPDRAPDEPLAVHELDDAAGGIDNEPNANCGVACSLDHNCAPTIGLNGG
ncbi:hypothetical protein [Longimicrobium sp.]|uniref:hypothetical protein n=1 Tax=Longimicrobium sp. TaxID=2029185 RepID=UPI002CD9B503|nr:hypothetical protein [Longimicrobium sp.]HSU15725.1 hypothetical protein [Longimicrobium sp.]